MDSSYDNSYIDEELIIQPHVLGDTVQKWLTRVPRFPKNVRRNTFAGIDTPESIFLASECSDSKMSNSNASFLDKMKAMLDEPPSMYPTTTYTKSRRSSLPNLDATTISNLETLSITKDYQQDISSSEIDDDFLRYQGTQVKYENITADLEDVDEHYDCAGDGDILEAENAEIEDVSEESLHDMNCKSRSVSGDYFENSCDTYSAPYLFSFANSEGLHAIWPQVAKLDITSLQTLKFENSFLEQRSTESIEAVITPQRHQVVTPSKVTETSILKPKNVSDKLEPLPRQPAFITPSKRPVKKPAHKFEHVQSPVGFYIKNSTTSAITRSVHGKKLPAILPDKFFEDIPDISDRWNFTIPKVAYAPRTAQVRSSVKDIVLPRSIKELVPNVLEMFVAKHGSRIKCTENQADVSRHLNEDMDLTRNAFMGQDISVIDMKHPFPMR